MNSILNYFIEANICLGAFALFYYVFLQHDNHFRFNRFFLIGSAGLSLVFPLLHIDPISGPKASITLFGNFHNVLALPEVMVFAHQANSAKAESIMPESISTVESINILIWIYLAVSVILLSIFCYRIYQVLLLSYSKDSVSTRYHNYTIIPTEGQFPTFSFFNMLFLDYTLDLSKDERQNVVDHEMVHIEQKHSLDIVFFELIKIIFWLNPSSWYLKRSVQQTHEYLADERLISTMNNRNQYTRLLAKMALTQMNLGIGHYFNQSFTLKRIKMMKKPRTNFRTWKWMALTFFVTVIFIAISCNEEVITDVNTVMNTATQTDLPAVLQPELVKLQEQYPTADFVYMETDGQNIEQMSRLQNIDPASIAYIQVWKERDMIGIILNKNGALKKMSDLNEINEVFTIVEDPAKPSEGFKVFYDSLGKRLLYPEKAKDMGKEGKVFVEFIVDTEGNLTDVKAVKGIGYGMDEAAVEAIQASDPWKPALQRGKKVKQKIILPISFSLGSQHKTSPKTEESMTMTTQKMKVTMRHEGLNVFGTVFDSQGHPLSGVNIIIADTHRGTVSDRNGEYNIKLNNQSDELHFSYISYKTEIRTIQ